MKVLHISTFDRGGAANSCIRLHLALLQMGIESKVLVKTQKSDYPDVISYVVADQQRIAKFIRKMGYKFDLCAHPDMPKREEDRLRYVNKEFRSFEYFATPFSDFDLTDHPAVMEADIVHLHWVAGFLDYSSFFKKIGKPVLWTLHDMAPFTGGNHFSEFTYDLDSDGKLQKKPLSMTQKKILEHFLSKKLEFDLPGKLRRIISPSNWLKTLSEKSELFCGLPHDLIPYGIDSQIFRIEAMETAREQLGMPSGKTILLFVADSLWNKRKGFFLLEAALKQLDSIETILCAIGKKTNDLKEGIIFTGEIQDPAQMALYYSAADGFILPSLEDNLPNTLLESLVCGTPVIGFPVGGIQETIIDGFNGYLCEEISIQALARKIEHFIKAKKTFDRKAIRSDAESKFSFENQAIKYRDLYTEVIGSI